jgi:hypothetical protein
MQLKLFFTHISSVAGSLTISLKCPPESIFNLRVMQNHIDFGPIKQIKLKLEFLKYETTFDSNKIRTNFVNIEKHFLMKNNTI